MHACFSTIMYVPSSTSKLIQFSITSLLVSISKEEQKKSMSYLLIHDLYAAFNDNCYESRGKKSADCPAIERLHKCMPERGTIIRNKLWKEKTNILACFSGKIIKFYFRIHIVLSLGIHVI